MHSASLFPFHDHPNASLSSTGHHTSTHTQTDCPNKHTEDMQECLHWPTCCSNTRTKKDTDIHTHIHTYIPWAWRLAGTWVAVRTGRAAARRWQSSGCGSSRLWVPSCPAWGLWTPDPETHTHTHTILHYFPVSSFIKAKKKKITNTVIRFQLAISNHHRWCYASCCTDSCSDLCRELWRWKNNIFNLEEM